MHILLLEDDPTVAEVFAKVFEQCGWTHELFTRVSDMIAALPDHQGDLLLLDWALPDGNSSRVIHYVRGQLDSDIPIIVESAHDDEDTIVDALQMGADDYVTKPLRIIEVRARIEALYRRSQVREPQDPVLCGYRVDETNRVLFFDDQKLEITGREYELAVYFLKHPNELLSRERLLDDVWGLASGIDTRTVDAHVSQVRKKLLLKNNKDLKISSLRGFGYRLEITE